MKVDSNITYTQQYKLKHGAFYDLNEAENTLGINKSIEKSNIGYKSGSTVNFGAAANFSYKMLKKISDSCNHQTVIMQNFISMLLAVVPRPIAIMLLPDPKRKNKKDKIAAATHAIASGMVGFAFASVIMYPLNIAGKKVKTGDAVIIANKFKELSGVDLTKKIVTKKELLEGTKIIGEKFLDLFGDFKDNKLVKINKNLNFDRVSKALDMSLDTFVLGIAKAMLTITLIPPIMKYLFGVEKTKQPEKVQTTNILNNQQKQPAKVEGRSA